MKVSRVKSNKDFLSGIAEGLRQAATRPTIHGYKPHDKQVKFHSSGARKKLFLGGNRSGKTVGGACESIWWLTGEHPYIDTFRPPVRGRVVSVDFINGVEKIVKPEVARWLPPSKLIDGSWEKSYNKELKTLTLANGSTLEFMSMDQDVDKFAGTSRHFTWFDEEPPREIYVECMQRLLDTGGTMWLTMTPVDGMSSWVYDDLYLAAKVDPGIHVVEVEMTENPHLNHGEIEVFLSGLTDDEKKARMQGRFIQIGGLVYKMFSQEKHVIEPFIPPESWLHVAAMDHGFNNPTAWLWAAIDPDGRIFVYDEYYKSGEVVAYHARAVHERNRVHERFPAYYVGDPSIRNTDPITGTSVLLEYIDFGIPIVLGNNDVKAGINRVARYLESSTGNKRLYITKNCDTLIREISRYRWGKWSSAKIAQDRNKKDEPHKKDDHTVDALRYLIASRPEMDDGSTIPENSSLVHASTAVTTYNRYDDEVTSAVRQESLDYHLGIDF